MAAFNCFHAEVRRSWNSSIFRAGWWFHGNTGLRRDLATVREIGDKLADALQRTMDEIDWQ